VSENTTSIESLEEAPLGNTFIQYLDSRNDMFERRAQNELQQFFSDYNINNHSEEAYLYTYAFVAAGWTRKAPEQLRNEYYIRTLEEASRADLSDFDAYTTRHSHRKQAAYYTGEALNDLHNLKVQDREVDSFTEFFTKLYGIEEGHETVEAFDVAMDSVRNQKQFQRLSAFDFLEFVARSLRHEWLLPSHLKPEYLKGNKPEEGFELLLGEPFDSEETAELLRIIEDCGREELDMPEVDVIFDIESCLCELKKDHEHGDLEETVHPEDHIPEL